MTYQNPYLTFNNSSNPFQTAVQAIKKTKKLPPSSSSSPPPKPPVKKSPRVSLRVKVVLSAIALSVIPVTVLGAIAYKVTGSHLTRQISQTQLERTQHLAEMLEKYIKNIANEGETLAESPIFTNPNIMKMVTVNQKKSALNAFQNQTGFYDSIVYLDLQGNPKFQSQSERPLRQNYSSQKYFQKAIASKQTTINEVEISPSTGELRMEFAVPVKNAWTGKVIGVMRFRIPSDRITPVFSNYSTKHEDWHLINTEKIFFASTVENLVNQPLAKHYPQLLVAHKAKQMITVQADNPEVSDQEQLVNYAPVKVGAINPELNLGTAISIDTDMAFAPLKPLRWVFLGGTMGTVLLVGSIAGFLANRIIQPLFKLTSAVSLLSQGKLNTRIKLDSQDELALLGEQINEMAEQLDITMQRQKTIARTSELMAKMSQARTPRELQLPFSLFLSEVRRLIKADRVIFYQFDQHWTGRVIAESVAQEFPRTLGVQFDDPCFAQEYVRKYQRGRIRAVADIHQASLTECHLQQLEPYAVKASLVLPVILDGQPTRESERLIGLLIAHQCLDTRVWEQSDIDYFQQIAYQLAMVLRSYFDHQAESLQKADIQKDVTQVLSCLEEMAKGNLSVNLSSEDFLAIDVTQCFETILTNMRQTVAQIKAPSKQINSELGVNTQDLAVLKDKLGQQANQLVLIFAFMDQIASSIKEVSSQVKLTSEIVNSVVTDMELEKANFLQASNYVYQLGNTLRDNSDKVKNLSSASQKMTRVISAIRKINLRASLLANKLSKRISKIDESEFGIQREIESIQESISATKELENVVRGIDNEISEVLRDYEVSENWLEQENHLIAQANSNLHQIAKISRNAQQQLVSLVNNTNSQVQTTKQINILKEELDKTANYLHCLSDRTFTSLEQTRVKARDLENVVDFFKLNVQETEDS